MGEAKRRHQPGGRAPRPREKLLEIRDPTEHEHIPGTVTVHVLHDSGASLTGTVLLSGIDECVRLGEKAGKRLGREEAREDARNYLATALPKGEHLRDPAVAGSIITSAVWLAWTAPEPQGTQMRERLRRDHRLVLAITMHSVHGLPAVNARMMLVPPETELPEILQEFGMGPPTEFVTRQLAPH